MEHLCPLAQGPSSPQCAHSRCSPCSQLHHLSRRWSRRRPQSPPRPMVSWFVWPTVTRSSRRWEVLEERIRFLNIDTPEVGTCMADRATAFTKRELSSGQTIELRYDRDLRDPYDRLLALVRPTAGEWLSVSLAESGLGFPLSIAPNSAYYGRVAAAAGRAKREGVGMFSPRRSCTPVARAKRAGSGREPGSGDAGAYPRAVRRSRTASSRRRRVCSRSPRRPATASSRHGSRRTRRASGRRSCAAWQACGPRRSASGTQC